MNTDAHPTPRFPLMEGPPNVLTSRLATTQSCFPTLFSFMPPAFPMPPLMPIFSSSVQKLGPQQLFVSRTGSKAEDLPIFKATNPSHSTFCAYCKVSNYTCKRSPAHQPILVTSDFPHEYLFFRPVRQGAGAEDGHWAMEMTTSICEALLFGVSTTCWGRRFINIS